MHNFEKYIPDIEKKISYVFKDKSLIRQAFTRASFCNEATGKIKPQSNEVLEFFGDSALSLAIVTYLIENKTERYPYGISTSLSEGEFSNIRSKLSNKKNLSDNIKRLGLEGYLILGEGDANLNIQNEPSVMEDLFESILGAIYIDSDYSVSSVMRTVSAMMNVGEYIAKGAAAPIQSFKNRLQEWCAAKERRLPPPRYEKISESGPDHNKSYLCACYIGTRLMGQGTGRSIKLAESVAAEEALKALSAKGEDV